MASRTRTGVAGLLAAVVLAVAWIVPATASTWTVTKLRDDQVGGPLFGISCPSAELCVATGSDSLIATSTNPSGGRTAWKVVHPGGAAEGPAELAEENLHGVVFPGAQVRGISCPSPSLCVAATFDGRIFSSTDPAGGASAWSIVPLGSDEEPNIHMTGISCPSPSLCVVAAYGGRVVYSTNPTGDASAWTATKFGAPFDLRGISCPTISFCAAVGNEGSILTSNNPTGSASAWSLVGAPGGRSGLNGVSCPAISLCVTGNAGSMITSTNPTDDLGAWNAVVAGTGLPLKGVSCPTTSACAAIDNNADAIVSTDPTGRASAWSFTNVILAPAAQEGTPNGMFGISCPTISLCAAAGQAEQIITSTDPFAPDPVKSQSRRGKRLRVMITHHPAKRVKPRKRGIRVTFRFRASGKVARFKCKLRGRGYRTCKSPKRYRVGQDGYTFKVLAIAPGGAKGSPTTFHFRVGQLTEPQPVGSCRPKPPGFPPDQPFEPCVNAN